MFLITVTGEIVANDKNHYAQGWTCEDLSKPIDENPYTDDKLQHKVDGNLILNKNVRAVPYAFYYSEKGICTHSSGEIIFAPGAMAAELYYKDNIAEIQKALNTEIPNDVKDYYYNGLLTGIFSVLELFLSDALLCLIFMDDKVYSRALVQLKQYKKNIKNSWDLELQYYYTSCIVYHRFSDVEKIYKDILNIKLPDTRKIKDYLPKRNNIVHRFSYSNFNRMRKIEIDISALNDLISECNDFVDKIMLEIKGNRETGTFCP